MLKYILTAVIIICLVIYFYAVSRSITIKKDRRFKTERCRKKTGQCSISFNKIKLVALIVLILTAIVTMIL